MTAPQIIIDLVDRFERNIEEYKRAHNETQIRREFIDPFFHSLGWDIDNKSGAAPQYQDVIHEAQQIVGGSMKAPDYAFRVGGTKKFYVEAKKPSVWVKEAPAPAYQVRSYGWSAKLPVSIVTDFEELAVYDCTQKPKNGDKPSVARINYFTYKEYLTRWDEIESVFSKEAVLKGQFDKYGETSKGKKGTTTVDKAFLIEIESWRELLAKNFAKNNKITEDELKFATQRTLDRIIFLRICEARGIEEEGRLQEAIAKPNSFKELFTLFQAADNRYNSGLFYFRKGDKVHKTEAELDTITPKLKLDDKILKEVIAGLYYPSPYKFDVIPADILGQVYEQFLGKVIRMTSGGMVKIEEKPEVRKAGGVYYTPTYIVDYIVKNTVGEILNDPKRTNIKILDPACGSGSFLLGAYDFLLKWYLAEYTKEAKTLLAKKNSPIYEVSTKNYALTTAEKKRILLEHIYGVDIDENAVEVAKLNLMLKCLEGEGAATLKLSVERILPDLSDNIKCGNSLIGSDFNDGLFSNDEHKKINPFDWNAEFSNIMMKGGFDAVIGNPPYVRQEGLGLEFKNYVENKYNSYHGVADLYTYFIERGVSLLKEGGRFSYIVANKWMRASYGEPLRRWMKERSIEEIIDFGDLQVFKGATTYTCILTISKSKAKKKFTAVNIKSLELNDLMEVVKKETFDINMESLKNEGWSLANPAIYKLLEKLEENGIPLGKYVDGKIYRGVLTGFNEAFVVDEATKSKLINEDIKSAEIIKPFLAGRDVKRYKEPIADKFLIFTRRGIDIKRYPAIEKHLLQYKAQLLPKPTNWKPKNENDKWGGRKGGRYQWYEIQDSIDYYEEFEKPKIMYLVFQVKNAFTYDLGNTYGNNATWIIPSSNKEVLGILNSKLGWFLISHFCTQIQGGYQLIYNYLEKVPIFSGKSKALVSLVDRMLTLNKELPLAKTPNDKTRIERQLSATDNEIDKLVYELYGLTEEEIKIVENN